MDPNVPTPSQPPVSSPSPVVAPPPVTTVPPSGKKKSKLIWLGVALVFLLVVVLGGIVLFKPAKKLPPVPSQLDKVVAVVGDTTIRKNDVWKKAREQYTGSAINEEVLEQFKGILVERAILNTEAKKLGLSVTDDEVNVVVGDDASDLDRETAKYDLLKAKVMAQQIQSVEAYTIGFYIAGFEYPQTAETNQQRVDGSRALVEIERRMKANEDPIAITASIYNTYPTLRNSVALNSSLYRNGPDQAVFKNPKVIAVKAIDPKGLSFDPVFYNVLTSIKTGEVKKGERIVDGSGGFVMKAVKVNSTGFSTYEEFLNAKKREYVVEN